jgi:hypothetical protein
VELPVEVPGRQRGAGFRHEDEVVRPESGGPGDGEIDGPDAEGAHQSSEDDSEASLVAGLQDGDVGEMDAGLLGQVGLGETG